MKIRTAYINNTLLVSKIRQNDFTVGRSINKLYVGKKDQMEENSQMIVHFAINMLNEEPVEFNYFDFVVHDAIYSILQNQNPNVNNSVCVSVGDILHLISGNQTQTITPTKKDRIKKSIEILAKTCVYIDFSEEAKCRNDHNKTSTFIYGPIAPLKQVGKTDRYEFTSRMMPLFYYSDMNQQVINYPTSLLKTEPIVEKDKEKKAVLFNTIEAITIKHYLIGRLETLRNPKSSEKNPQIAYYRRDGNSPNRLGGLIAETGIFPKKVKTNEADLKRKISTNNIVTTILNDFKNKGYIYGYEINYDGRIPKTIKLTPNPVNTKEKEYVNNPFLEK